MKLSVVIPARNEVDCLQSTILSLYQALQHDKIDHEILVINDASTDGTEALLLRLGATVPTLRYRTNRGPNGFGLAVRMGLETSRGEAVAVFMADLSDNPHDLVRFFHVMEESQYDCVFGTRFAAESKIIDYPRLKLILNRLANKFIQILFGLSYNDVTNAFKMYRRHTLEGLKPYLSHHFNLTVELPLKAIVRGYRYTVLPNDWTQRKTGESKLKIKEMGSRYLFIVLYCFIEKWLARGDYRATAKPVEIKRSA